MYFHWKSLLAFGFIFWLMLCATDFLGDKRYQKPASNIDFIYDDAVMNEIVEKKVQMQINKMQKPVSKMWFGWSLIIWNSLAFMFSIFFCIIARSFAWVIFQWYSYYRNKKMLKICDMKSERPTVSRIPILTYKSQATLRASETNIKQRNEHSTSYSNLHSDLKTSNSIESQQIKPACQMIFKNDMFSTNNPGISTQSWQEYCAKLRDEMLKSQGASLREHANLSRKLDAISKEKKELSKQLAVSHKENRAAKQQLEELLQEKSMLLRRLENATKEFRVNTKTKKAALAKLDEITGNVEDLKLQLEQVSRDKEILENKFKVLEEEYIKLQDRLMKSREQGERIIVDGRPERDGNVEHNLISDSVGDNCGSLFPSIPQAELDMKKIETKIKQLEKSLENFNCSRPNLNLRLSGNSLESDISSSWLENTTECKSDEYWETTDPESTHQSWATTVGEVMQSISKRVNDKVRFLESARDNCNSPTSDKNSHSRSDMINGEPRRIVSSSLAFQNFLKGLHQMDSS